MKLFVGTNFGHGAAVAALNEIGEVIFAADEGRLKGIKDCDEFPAAALQALLDNCPAREIMWAEGWDLKKRYLHKGILTAAKYGLGDSSYFRARLFRETNRIYRGWRGFSHWKPILGKPQFTGHHLAHAYSLLPWGLPEKSIVLVSDTTAEWASISILYWSGVKMSLLDEVPYPHSPGAAFHQMARNFGFQGRTAPGKLMALAGYGQPKWTNELTSICTIDERGFRFDLSSYPAWHRTEAWQRFAVRSASRALRQAILEAADRSEIRADLARSVQDWFTITTLSILKNALHLARHRYGLEVHAVGLAGGSALNCETNRSLIRNLEKHGIQLILSPWSDDPGTAIGAATWLFNKMTGKRPKRIEHSFLGPEACRKNDAGVITDEDLRAAATALSNRGILALVSGRLEFGPRALGNRCLLGDARFVEVRDKLNRMKQRPSFMPFAPVVFESDFQNYFEGEGSNIMAWTVTATSRGVRELPAAIHANGQARVQTLKSNGHLLSRLLRVYRDSTGTGVLLLTSLNGKHQPIASNVAVAREIGRQLGVDGILCDQGWFPAIGVPQNDED